MEKTKIWAMMRRKKERKKERKKDRKKKNFGDAIRRKKETSSLDVLPKEFRNFKQFN
jgi:hypothetical protein